MLVRGCGASIPAAAESTDEAHQQGAVLGADAGARGERGVCGAGERRTKLLPGKLNRLLDGHAAYGGTETLEEKQLCFNDEQ